MTCGCHIHHTNKCGNAPTGMAALSYSSYYHKRKKTYGLCHGKWRCTKARRVSYPLIIQADNGNASVINA